MPIAEFKVSGRGQMALPAEARRRWNLGKGGKVEVADLGHALLIVPAGRGGLRGMCEAQSTRRAATPTWPPLSPPTSLNWRDR